MACDREQRAKKAELMHANKRLKLKQLLTFIIVSLWFHVSSKVARLLNRSILPLTRQSWLPLVQRNLFPFLVLFLIFKPSRESCIKDDWFQCVGLFLHLVCPTSHVYWFQIMILPVKTWSYMICLSDSSFLIHVCTCKLLMLSTVSIHCLELAIWILTLHWVRSTLMNKLNDHKIH